MDNREEDIRNGKYIKIICSLWSDSPPIAVVDLERELSRSFDSSVKYFLMNELFCLYDNIIDRHLFEIHGPKFRDILMPIIRPVATQIYSETNDLDIIIIAKLSSDRRSEWGSYRHFATKEGDGGLAYHASQHLAEIIEGNRYDVIFLDLYRYLLKQFYRVGAVLVTGYSYPDSMLEKI